jgi:hypothetical protein
MEEKIKEFKALWPTYLEQVYDDATIELYISEADSIEMAVDHASDNMMAQDLGYVEE